VFKTNMLTIFPVYFIEFIGSFSVHLRKLLGKSINLSNKQMCHKIRFFTGMWYYNEVFLIHENELTRKMKHDIVILLNYSLPSEHNTNLALLLHMFLIIKLYLDNITFIKH